MRQVIVYSPAKLNLTFDILGLLGPQCHEVETLLQAVDLEDELSFEMTEDEKTGAKLTETKRCTVEILCEDCLLQQTFPCDSSNLISKAAQAFVSHLPEAQEISCKLRVRVIKRIPIGAGLAGGSSNAAATLLALNCLFDNPFSFEKLVLIAKGLGADVPFCLSGGTQIGRQRGDTLSPVKHSFELLFCLVKPRHLAVSTPWAYKAYDTWCGDLPKPDLGKAIAGLANGHLETALNSFGNVFEPIVFAKYKQLKTLKESLLALGCWCCHLTGSGPTLYAIVGSREMAHHIRRKLINDEDYGFSYIGEDCEPKQPIDFWIVSSINYGARIVA